ncbi:hypothetical protein MF672_038050 [Actinomadura sp. ATCC 31491]|uniref:Uncharacterized protein n=1 Tax=Actinomadura luzonensis TaxID=2805427 RepID=A0ABT0G650_9ACTN|nr:hypothetical protein [Actinomadura luzonensis]MCK2219556.1 hypothetical protein [Actinomadura luzonensis]
MAWRGYAVTYRWRPYVARGLLRVVEASRCERYVLCYEEGEFFVLRRAAGTAVCEEAVRGGFAAASSAWVWLTRACCLICGPGG